MALITCAGADVLKGRMFFPLRGAWYADLVLDTTTEPSGLVTIAADGGLSVKGTVKRSGVFLDSAHVRIVGGAGGLTDIISPAAYENALLRDPLNAVLSAAGESLSSTVDASILNSLLDLWTNVAQRASEAIDRLCFVAGLALGQTIGWRVLSDGSIWVGSETWPSQKMPDNSDILMRYPEEKRVELSVQTPSLLPGVALEGVGNVSAVDHWLDPDETRTDLWL